LRLKRLISAICILPPLGLIVYFAPPAAFLFLLTSVVGLGQWEFYRMLSTKGVPCRKWLGAACGMALPLAAYSAAQTAQTALTAIILLVFITGLLARQEFTSSLQSIAFTLLGIVYVGWLLSYVPLLRLSPDGPAMVFFLFSVVWLGDAAALVAGTLLGRHKLAPFISPRKTVEGAIGGVLGSLGGAILVRMLLLENLSLLQCMIAGVMLAVFGQLGDLCESLVKRSSGIKDSAMLIPGHGGILDKVDGILFGAPALYYFVLYVVGQELPS
jgi:phosphatidate cytidylyltransferase